MMSFALQCTSRFPSVLPFQLTFQELMNFAGAVCNSILCKIISYTTLCFAAVKNVLAFSHSRGLKINEPCDIIDFSSKAKTNSAV